MLAVCEDLENGEVGAVATHTHVVFCIDQSGSMNRGDATTAKGKKVRRWDAVFECAIEFVRWQLATLHEGTVSFSLVLFSEAPKVSRSLVDLSKNQELARVVVFERESEDVATRLLEQTRLSATPAGGTTFAAGLAQRPNVGILWDSVVF